MKKKRSKPTEAPPDDFAPLSEAEERQIHAEKQRLVLNRHAIDTALGLLNNPDTARKWVRGRLEAPLERADSYPLSEQEVDRLYRAAHAIAQDRVKLFEQLKQALRTNNTLLALRLAAQVVGMEASDETGNRVAESIN